MDAFTRLDGLVVPIDRANVDTDAILPKQFMKSTQRTGFGPHLFDAWRYLDHGSPGQDCSNRPLSTAFVLNQPRYQGAQILLARENFGCGSSREHALWALRDHGIRALIAPSFSDIFTGNCSRNRMLPVVLAAHEVDRMFECVQHQPGYRLRIDLQEQTVQTTEGFIFRFTIDSISKRMLLNGLDEIDATLELEESIRAYEHRRRIQEPWLFESS